ncbi:hypothetical protein BDC45DRAFT_562666 [Circinella umbellata]|nr:hypothetical protein BDC45DRAFT_562666 [Circinella umbellata]
MTSPVVKRFSISVCRKITTTSNGAERVCVQLDYRSIKWILWRLLGEGLKEYDTMNSFGSELDCRSIKRFLWRLLGEGLKGQSWIIDLSSGCFTASSVKFLKVKATRSAIEIASVPTDSTSRNNRFCPGAKLRVSTKASDFSREIEGHFCGISL